MCSERRPEGAKYLSPGRSPGEGNGPNPALGYPSPAGPPPGGAGLQGGREGGERRCLNPRLAPWAIPQARDRSFDPITASAPSHR
jgi:hypothetical protein